MGLQILPISKKSHHEINKVNILMFAVFFRSNFLHNNVYLVIPHLLAFAQNIYNNEEQ